MQFTVCWSATRSRGLKHQQIENYILLHTPEVGRSGSELELKSSCSLLLSSQMLMKFEASITSVVSFLNSYLIAAEEADNGKRTAHKRHWIFLGVPRYIDS